MNNALEKQVHRFTRLLEGALVESKARSARIQRQWEAGGCKNEDLRLDMLRQDAVTIGLDKAQSLWAKSGVIDA